MPSALVNGCTIQYEVLGAASGESVVLTPGGRQDMESVRPLAERLAETGRYRVIIYDRRNCGASDVIIAGDKPEHDIWADDIAELLRQLDAAPAWVGGSSAGARASLLTAVRHSDVVKGLLLWWITGGTAAAEQLGEQYYDQFIRAAEQDDMAGVLATAFFAERAAQNPANRQRLLDMTPETFIAVMRGWRTAFHDRTVVLGLTDDEIRGIHVPVVIVPGNDAIHPTPVAEYLHQLLPQSVLHPHPWADTEMVWRDSLTLQQRTDELSGRLAPLFLDFLMVAEARV